MNNARFGQFLKVYEGLKHQRRTVFLDNMITQLTVDFEMHGLRTMRACRFDDYRQRFFS